MRPLLPLATLVSLVAACHHPRPVVATAEPTARPPTTAPRVDLDRELADLAQPPKAAPLRDWTSVDVRRADSPRGASTTPEERGLIAPAMGDEGTQLSSHEAAAHDYFKASGFDPKGEEARDGAVEALIKLNPALAARRPVVAAFFARVWDDEILWGIACAAYREVFTEEELRGLAAMARRGEEGRTPEAMHRLQKAMRVTLQARLAEFDEDLARLLVLGASGTRATSL